MRWLLLMVAVAGCDSDVRSGSDDAAVVDIDADVSGPLMLTCESYCSGIMAACTDANAQFASAADCMKTCMAYTPGMLTDTAVSTLGCRVHHTELARTDPTMHCQHAGPTGGGLCGGKCDAACDVIPALCPDQWSGPNCNCGNLSASSTPYSTASSTGNTLDCRINQAVAGNCDATQKVPPEAPCM